jgi:hypothetical protein
MEELGRGAVFLEALSYSTATRPDYAGNWSQPNLLAGVPRLTLQLRLLVMESSSVVADAGAKGSSKIYHITPIIYWKTGCLEVPW